MKNPEKDWLGFEIQAQDFAYQSLFLSSSPLSSQPLDYHTQDWLFLAGNEIVQKPIHQAHLQEPDWYFGHLCYELKNDIHQLSSQKPTPNYPLQQWIKAEWVVQKKNGVIKVWKGKDFQRMEAGPRKYQRNTLELRPGIDQPTYLKNITKVKEYIRKGACYELNYCFPFLGKVQPDFQPWAFFETLANQSPMPFSNFYQTPEFWAMGASPERYLKKIGDNVISQPIKGTRRRCEINDQELIEDLKSSEKENAEHVMIVDLMRNDLAKFCVTGSIKVHQLKEVFTFPRVHQMISTIEGTLTNPENGLKLLIDAFPMGSMTGAPKRRVMEIIDELEIYPRGLYSGSIGYLQPNGDFDFNVVIRTLLVERTTLKASTSVGGAITFLSDPIEEYEECWIKATPILNLSNSELN